jgi:hypothetical protein
MSQLGIPNTNNTNNNNNRGGRGGNTPQANSGTTTTPPATPQNAANATNQNPQNAQNNNPQNNNFQGRGGNNNNNLQAEVRKKNEELLDKVAASLNPTQGKIVKKLKYDQIKARGGSERYRAIMEEEGTPLTPEQTTQIQQLVNAQNQAIRQFAQQQVQQEMTTNPPPETMPAPDPNQQQGRGRGNANSVGQNPYAQQVVAKLMPIVSRQRVLIEKTTTDQIMKLFTPSQVASYKLNSL